MPNTITPEEVAAIQRRLGLRDTQMAEALGITRQTWRNWRTGRTIPYFVGHALRAIDALHQIDPANDNLPAPMRRGNGAA